MTWVKCHKCGYVTTVASVDVLFNTETGEYETSTPALKWKCPKCSEFKEKGEDG